MITASALAPNCAYAKVLSASKVMTPAQQASIDAGRAFHAAIEAWKKAGEVPQVEDLEMQGWLDLLASQWVPPADLELEIAWGLSPEGLYVEVDEPEPHVYVAKDGGALLTAGRADACWTSVNALIVVDWKTGKWPVAPASENLQALAGGLALSQRLGRDVFYPTIYYARDGHFDIGNVVGPWNWQDAALAVERAALLPPEPRPGEWCGKCWERKVCPRGPR